MNNNFTKLMLAALLTGGCLSASAQQLAFPEAAGWGRFAVGARNGGTVYHVTNLNDSGTGSLRDAISQSNRFIVFDVSGVINIKDRLVFKNNQYIAGQTAPGEGITVYGNGVSFSGASNIIVRHMRFRMGHGGSSGKDCAGIASGHDMIFDHCSFSWGLDETFSINSNGAGSSHHITISNSIMSQGLQPHSAGGLMQDPAITLYRNLYADNKTRNNKIKTVNQYTNNIVYNWNAAAYNMGGDSEGDSYCNIESNLFISGPSGGKSPFTGGNSNFHCYGDDNWQDTNNDGTYNPWETTDYSGADRKSEPYTTLTFNGNDYTFPILEKWAAKDLVDKLLPVVGANLPYRDMVDFYVVNQVKSFGKDGALISTEEQLPFGVPSSWTTANFTKPVDTDNDGIPDEWEKNNGLNPNDPSDATKIAANGYANIENYINSLTVDNRPLYLRAPLFFSVASSTENSITLSWSDYTEGEEGFILEQKDGDTWKEWKRIPANTESYVLSGLEPGTTYNLRLKAYKGENYSDAVELVAKSRPKYVEMVDCDNFVGDADNWLIAPTTDETETLEGSVTKKAVVVRSDANVTLAGTGSLDGEASLNKTGKGTLKVETENGYKGATVLHDGVFSFATLKNGGVNSSIGASDEFAQNWIWNGGTWNYTGGNTSTNRNAQLYKDTEFRVENASTVTMNGAIEGDGNMTFSGKGTISPASPSFFQYNGKTVLADGGTLKLGYLKSVESKQIFLGDETANPALVLAGGNFTVANGSGLTICYRFPIEVKEGTYSTFKVDKLNTIRSSVSGTGTLELQIPYVREYIEGDWTKFYGTLVAKGLGSSSEGSQLMFQSGSKGMPNARVRLITNTRLMSWANNANLRLGGLSGDKGTYIGSSGKNANSAMTWRIGNANTDEEFNGVIDNKTSAGKEGKTNIIKEGSGVWRVNGNNTYTGSTVINGGTMVFNGKNTGAGNITVNNEGSKLAGKGSLAGAVVIGANATIQAGDTLVNGSVLTLGKTLALRDGTTVEIPADKMNSNYIAVGGAVTMGQNVTLKIADGEFKEAPYADTKIQVFSSANLSITGQFAKIVPEVPGVGQTWDTSALYTEGYIKVVGGEAKPVDPTPDPDPDPTPGETKYALLAYGNMVAGSYDNSSYKNMLTGAQNDEAAGFSMVITGNLAKSYTKGSSNPKMTVEYKGEEIQRTPIVGSNQTENTIFLPENAKVTKMRIWSYTSKNSSDRPTWWSNVAGKEYAKDETTELRLTSTVTDPDDVTFTLPSVSETLTFKNTGEAQAYIIALEYYLSNSTGIDNAATGGVPVRIQYYDLKGGLVANPSVGGIYIMRATMDNGKVIVRKVMK